MRKTMLFGIAALMAGCLATHVASAQIQWTPEQKAVWKTETDQTDLWMKGDIQGGLAYFDDSFLNWANSPVPVPKSIMEKNISYFSSLGRKMDYAVVVPTAIWVNGNYAYADYYSLAIYENKDGKKTTYRDRNLDVLLKKDGKWVIVGSLTADYAPGK